MEEKKKKFINKPYYEGGNEALRKFIHLHLVYPEEAVPHKIAGIVNLKIDIDHKGYVKGAKVKKGLGHGCDEEAVRVAKMIRFHVKKNKGVKVTFHKNLNIRFDPPKPSGPQLNYVITGNEKKTEQKQSSTTWSYTLTKKN